MTGGSYSTSTYIILDGEAIVFGMNEDMIGFMRAGGHYSNSLFEDDEEILG